MVYELSFILWIFRRIFSLPLSRLWKTNAQGTFPKRTRSMHVERHIHIDYDVDRINGRCNEMDMIKIDCRRRIENAIHYPDCWDTVAYPTLESAIWEIIAWQDIKCTTCHPQPQGRL